MGENALQLSENLLVSIGGKSRFQLLKGIAEGKNEVLRGMRHIGPDFYVKFDAGLC